MSKMVMRFFRDDDGQDLIEYGPLAAFISLVAIVAITSVGTSLNGTYDSFATKLGSAAS